MVRRHRVEQRADHRMVTAGVEYDVLGIGCEDPAVVAPEDRAAIVALHPRPGSGSSRPSRRGSRRPETTFSATLKTDVLRHFVAVIRPGDFVQTVRGSAWPE